MSSNNDQKSTATKKRKDHASDDSVKSSAKKVKKQQHQTEFDYDEIVDDDDQSSAENSVSKGDRRESSPTPPVAASKKKQQSSGNKDVKKPSVVEKPVVVDADVEAKYGSFVQKESLAHKQEAIKSTSFDTINVEDYHWKVKENHDDSTNGNTPGFGKVFGKDDTEYQAMFTMTAMFVTAVYLDGNGNTTHDKTTFEGVSYAVCVRDTLPPDYVDVMMRRDERNMEKLGQVLPENHRQTLEKQAADLQAHITAVFDGAERLDKHLLSEMASDEILGRDIRDMFDDIVDGQMLTEYRKRVDKKFDPTADDAKLDEDDERVIALRKELLAEQFIKFKTTLRLVKRYQTKAKGGQPGETFRCMWFTCPVYRKPFEKNAGTTTKKDDAKAKQKSEDEKNEAEMKAKAKGADPIKIKETMEKYGFERFEIPKVDNKGRPIPAPADPFTDVQVWPHSLCSFKVRIKSSISSFGTGNKGELFCSKRHPFQVNRAGRKVSNFQEEQIEVIGGGEWDDISE